MKDVTRVRFRGRDVQAYHDQASEGQHSWTSLAMAWDRRPLGICYSSAQSLPYCKFLKQAIHGYKIKIPASARSYSKAPHTQSSHSFQRVVAASPQHQVLSRVLLASGLHSLDTRSLEPGVESPIPQFKPALMVSMRKDMSTAEPFQQQDTHRVGLLFNLQGRGGSGPQGLTLVLIFFSAEACFGEGHAQHWETSPFACRRSDCGTNQIAWPGSRVVRWTQRIRSWSRPVGPRTRTQIGPPGPPNSPQPKRQKILTLTHPPKKKRSPSLGTTPQP